MSTFDENTCFIISVCYWIDISLYNTAHSTNGVKETNQSHHALLVVIVVRGYFNGKPVMLASGASLEIWLGGGKVMKLYGSARKVCAKSPPPEHTICLLTRISF